jgi:hypothetical protein
MFKFQRRHFTVLTLLSIFFMALERFFYITVDFATVVYYKKDFVLLSSIHLTTTIFCLRK